MKKIIIISLVFLTVSCATREKPLFVKIDRIQVESSTLDSIVLTADAYFINQNDVGGSLKSKNIEIFINDISVATMSSKAFDVPSRKEFTIPLKVFVPTKEIFENNKNGLLGGILSSIANKKMKVHYKGTITYTKFGFSYDYEVDKTQDITLKF